MYICFNFQIEKAFEYAINFGTERRFTPKKGPLGALLDSCHAKPESTDAENSTTEKAATDSDGK